MKSSETPATTETEVPGERLLSTGTVAKMLRVTGRTICRYVDAGKFGKVARTAGGRRKGGHYRIRESAVLNLARSMGIEVPA